MESVRIHCFSVKESLRFSVDIDPNASVPLLVKVITAELESQQQRKVPADMQLYLARMGGEWLDLAGVEAVTLDDRGIPMALDGHGQPHYFEEMDPFYSLSSDRCFGGDFRVVGKFQVLVVESVRPRLQPYASPPARTTEAYQFWMLFAGFVGSVILVGITIGVLASGHDVTDVKGCTSDNATDMHKSVCRFVAADVVGCLILNLSPYWKPFVDLCFERLGRRTERPSASESLQPGQIVQRPERPQPGDIVQQPSASESPQPAEVVRTIDIDSPREDMTVPLLGDGAGQPVVRQEQPSPHARPLSQQQEESSTQAPQQPPRPRPQPKGKSQRSRNKPKK